MAHDLSHLGSIWLAITHWWWLGKRHHCMHACEIIQTWMSVGPVAYDVISPNKRTILLRDGTKRLNGCECSDSVYEARVSFFTSGKYWSGKLCLDRQWDPQVINFWSSVTLLRIRICALLGWINQSNQSCRVPLWFGLLSVGARGQVVAPRSSALSLMHPHFTIYPSHVRYSCGL